MKDAFKHLLGNKWLLVITMIGILLLIFGASGGVNGSSPGGGSATPVVAVSNTPTSVNTTSSSASTRDAALQTAISYENYYDVQLEHMIDQIAGISDALVMVTVDSTSIAHYGQNVTTTRQTTVSGGTSNPSNTTTQSSSSQIVLLPQSSGNQVPVVIEQQLPHITGVMVVAKAADPIRMESEIVNAVQDALGIPGYQITVLPRK